MHIYNVKVNKSCDSNSIEKLIRFYLTRDDAARNAIREQKKQIFFFSIQLEMIKKFNFASTKMQNSSWIGTFGAAALFFFRITGSKTRRRGRVFAI